MSEFRKELEETINKHSCENESDTPDFILADYLQDCLKAFDSAVRNRERWYGREHKPEETQEQTASISFKDDKIIVKSDSKITTDD